MANRISEDLFQAIDVIVNKRIGSIEKDKTILCTVEDNSHAKEGIYTVANASVKFEAVGQDTTYRVGQNVWVLIPDGDYNNDKLIVSKYTKDDASPYVWVDPLHSYANVTGQVLTAYDFTEIKNVYNSSNALVTGAGLLANKSRAVDITTGNPLPGTNSVANVLAQWIRDEQARDAQKAANPNATLPASHFTPINGVAGLDRVGISADFKTAFGSTPAIAGNYGLEFVIKTELQVDTGTPGEGRFVPEYRYIPVELDTSDMWGDPYNFSDYFQQSTCFDIKPEENGKPVGYIGVFYQMNNFIGEDGTALPYQYTETNIINGETVTTNTLLDPNIYVKNINMSFGYAVDEVEDDTVFLFTTDSLIYVVDNYSPEDGTAYDKLLQARFIYVGDDDTRVAINNYQDYQDYATANGSKKIQALVDMHPVFRWYQEDWSIAGTDGDPRVGRRGLWKEIKMTDPATDQDAFFHTVHELKRTDYERFMCVVCYNNKYNDYKNGSGDENAKRWAETDQIIGNANGRNVVEFKNKNNAWDMARDLVQSLKLAPAKEDASKGVFNLYEATFGANSSLINPKDEQLTRTMSLTFWSAVTGQDELDTAERIAWYIPRNNTMIKMPRQNLLVAKQTLLEPVNSNGEFIARVNSSGAVTTAWQNAWNANLNNAALGLSQAEKDLFNEYVADYYIIVDTTVADPMRPENGEISSRTVEARLNYYIKKDFIKHWTNNTIRASAYRYQRNYQSSYELHFGAKGTNGTGYTLMLTMVEETKNDGTKVANPPAWTWTTGAADDDTDSIQLEALLFDPDENDVTSQAKFTWSVYVPIAIGVYQWASGTWVLSQYMSGVNTSRPVMKDFPSNRGWILKCQAALGNNTKIFTGYLIIPMRTTRDFIAMDGPNIVRYNSAGTNPQFYDGAFGLIDTQENIDYNYNIKTITVEEGYFHNNGSVDIAASAEWKNYFPTLEQNRGDSRYHLKPKAMFFKDINKKKYPNTPEKAQVYNVSVEFRKSDDTFIWANPILILLDPYGNQLLNNWGGELNIDYDNNTIMSAVMGTGRKESDNSFTGLLMGDLPHVDNNVTRSGMVGYEHGEAYYQLYDNGTMYLGKPSTAQISFNGTDGYIQNASYPNTGIRINFAGATTASTAGMGNPYIHLKRVPTQSSQYGGEIILNTGGPGPNNNWSNRYFIVKGSGQNAPGATASTVSTWTPTDLIHIGDDAYYLRTENFKFTTATATDNHGFKLDLKNGKLESYDNLQIIGGPNSKIHFGNATNYLELGYNGTNGYLTSTDKLNIQGGTLGEDSSILLSTDNTTISSLAGQANKTNWRLSVGSHFGVDANGNLYANSGKIGNWTIDTNEMYAGSFDSTNHTGTAIQATGDKAFVAGGWDHTNYGNAYFYVTHGGYLYAKNAKIEGEITANSGKIGGCTIDEDGKLWIPAANISGTLSATQINTSGLSLSGSQISGTTLTFVTDVDVSTRVAGWIGTTAEGTDLYVRNIKVVVNRCSIKVLSAGTAYESQNTGWIWPVYTE